MAGFDIKHTELIWPGKYNENGKRREIERANLPFQVIERVKESRATREATKERGATLFDVWEGDEGQTFDEGWRNKLIWGDNLLVMSSLLDQFTGKIDLIYIDPPFATGTDFTVTTRVGEEAFEATKAPTAIEEKAYRDTWGEGLGSYLSMLYDRLTLMRDLLATGGSIFVHVDRRVGPHVKHLLDEIFGAESLINEIVWCYTGPSSPGMRAYANKHDTIYWYGRGASWTFNVDDVRLPYAESTQRNEGRRTGFTTGNPDLVVELNPLGKYPEDWWQIPVEAPASPVRTEYPTQKPERLLTKILAGSTNPGDLVADFFVGSGTAAAVAEKLGRRWIACDLGRYAIHVTRKRILDIPDCKSFEVLNLGKYERQYWSVATFGDDLDEDGTISLFEYVAFILKLYGATATTGLQHLHGKHSDAFVHVGAVDAPVTFDEVTSAVAECAALKAGELHILGWEWEMGLNDLVSDDAKKHAVKIVLRQIPREVMEAEAARKGDVQFFELAYLEASIEPTKNAREYRVSLENFVIPNPELVPDEVREQITRWSDYVDYWAVDWDFRDDTFIQGWVTYRTRRDRSLELVSDPHVYEAPGEYRIMIKVIDVFGNDTSKLVTVSVD